MSYLEGMDKLISIDVPAPVADEVRRFVAFLVADRMNPAAHAVSPSDGIPDYPLWPDERIVRFASAPTTTARVYLQIMDAVVEHDAAGRWLSIAELAEWTEQPVSVISAFRTHLYRYINAHLPEGTLAPFTRATGQDLRPARGREVYYRISTECAAQWTRLRDEISNTNVFDSKKP